MKGGFTMPAIFIRTLVIYIVLIVVMRFLGKRQIGQMQISELVTTFLLSELASQPLINVTVPLLYSVLPILILVCLEIFFSFLPTKVDFIKKLLDSTPSFIIKKGKIDIREMERMRMSLEDLLCELHVSGYLSPSEIDYAILESNGRLSFFPKDENSPLKKGDIENEIALSPPSIASMAYPVIVDGKIVKYALDGAGKNEKWVKKELLKKCIKHKDEVFLMTVDDDGETKIIKREECI